ncbi:MAG: ribulose-phosphate 3-epimerase [Halobacteriovoraceae bacterium]|nr:ribulose-phosphate 3-epimerase [Halobacteriovoraceae bacterium]
MSKKTTISPSLLSADFLNLQTEIDYFSKLENLWLHLDVMDGHFVPNLTFGTPIINKLKKATPIKLDAHFMVTNPLLHLELFKDSGLHNFTFHWESLDHHHRFIEEAKKYYPSVGISLNPSTPISVVPEFILKSIDLILVMTVNPGFGGQSFISECLDKVRELKKIRDEKNFHYIIQVDGGINNNTAKETIEAGADNLVAGSYIFKHQPSEYEAAVESLRS